MYIIVKKQLPGASIVLDTFWKFAQERQEIFFRKINGEKVITEDEILLKHKFTNAYRASDRVSQYLIREVIYKGSQEPRELLFRILLFKIFNKISTWEILISEMDEVKWSKYRFERYNQILHQIMEAGEAIYSGAYIMASGKSIFGHKRKHENHLRLIEQVMSTNLVGEITSARSLSQIYQILLDLPTIGSFLAYQYAIDINYSVLTDFSEMDFVVPGPGAKDGLKKCFKHFGDYNPSEVIHYVTDIQEQEFERLGLSFRNLWGRPLQLIDCQNLFCETDKYSRVAHPDIPGISDRKRIKQLYKITGEKISYFYPPKWGINQLVKSMENNIL